MAIIRDSTQFIGTLEQGQLHQDLMEELHTAVLRLQEIVGDSIKAKAKASVSLTIKLELEEGRIVFSNDLSSKLPKIPRRSTVLFVTDDGDLSTQHPKQHDMFGGPNAVPPVRAQSAS